MFPAKKFFLVFGVLGVLLFTYMIVIFVTELHEEGAEGLFSKLCWRNATVRPPFLLVLIIGGWGLVVRICRESGLNLDAVLGGRLQATAASYHAALVLLCIVLFAHLVHLIASEIPGITWRPWLTCNLALHVAIAAVGCAPYKVFHHESRFSLLNTLWESLIAPLAPVHFWHVIVADYLTSLAKAFSDLQLSACISSHIVSERAPTHGAYTPTSVLWEAHYFGCADTWTNALMLALPFWWRLMQCLKVYSGNGELKNLWNALKYSTAFPLVYAGYLRRHHPSPKHDHLFMLCAIMQSSYCYFWDVQMDWGLLRRDPRTALGWSMRDQLLITPRKWVYLLVCTVNLCLRFVWALSLFGVATSPGGGMFFLEAVEILRRTVWAVFRIEWEVIVKVGSANAYANIPLSSPGQGGKEMSSDLSDVGSDVEGLPLRADD